jgi:bifunctional non-homologous end joining protein LigD
MPHSFVVHEHHATHLHYDLRLEMDGVLKSWALPKGPSMNPAERHLAVMVEDHPLEYADFEGVIPEGSYGAGPVVIWDSGTYEVAAGSPAPHSQLAGGKLSFMLFGRKLRGGFTLVRLARGDGRQWLFIKRRDAYADPSWRLESELAPGGRRARARRVAAG